MMRYTLVVIVLLFTFSSCGKDDDQLPDVPVRFSRSLKDPSLNRLSTVGGAVAISGYGIAGLIIYRGANGYVAFDACSTVNPIQKCAVVIDDPAFTVTDPCSGAKFSIIDGSPVKAPAKYFLKKYAVSHSNDFIQITN